jgi:hypothetical protein
MLVVVFFSFRTGAERPCSSYGQSIRRIVIQGLKLRCLALLEYRWCFFRGRAGEVVKQRPGVNGCLEFESLGQQMVGVGLALSCGHR